MKRDFYIGGIVSLGLHFGLASFNPTQAAAVVTPKVPEELIDFIEVVRPEEVFENLPSGDAKAGPTAHTDFPPPSLADAPQVPRPDTFLMPLQSPVERRIQTNSISVPEFSRRSGGGGGGGGILELGMLDQQPMAKVQPKPVYPFEMRREGSSGEVVVDFVVDARGDVRNAFVVRSTRPEFEVAAVQAVSKWKFRPGKKAGQAVAVHMQVPIVFQVENDRE